MASIRREIVIEARPDRCVGRDTRCGRGTYATCSGLCYEYQDGRRRPHRDVRQRPGGARADRGRRRRRAAARLGWWWAGGSPITMHRCRCSRTAMRTVAPCGSPTCCPTTLPDHRRHDRAGHERHEENAGGGGAKRSSVMCVGQTAVPSPDPQPRPRFRGRQDAERCGRESAGWGCAGACGSDRPEGTHSAAHGLRGKARQQGARRAQRHQDRYGAAGS